VPMPRWWGQINKRVFNPRAIAGGKWPVLTHLGRVSGAMYRTPLDAHPVDGGYLSYWCMAHAPTGSRTSSQPAARACNSRGASCS
jgi:hypothetical protein